MTPNSYSSDQPAEPIGRRVVTRSALVALTALALAACGMKGDPEIPADAPRRTPRQYPAQ
jgi:predicted small lipoprotein YifL